MNIQETLEQALGTVLGLELQFNSKKTASYWRKRIYTWREKQRLQGITCYDQLSLVITKTGNLHIIQRDSISNPSNILPNVKTRPLEDNDLPPRLLSRGKS